jgi:hypothetical protein
LKPAASENALFQRFVNAQIEPTAFTVRELVDTVVGFYQSQRARGLSSYPDSDMLLFQWGTYDWGEGGHFEVDMVRQFAKAQPSGDPVLSQLHATAYFGPSGFSELSASHFWCHSVEDSGDFRERVLASAAFERTADLSPRKSEIRWELV